MDMMIVLLFVLIVVVCAVCMVANGGLRNEIDAVRDELESVRKNHRLEELTTAECLRDLADRIERISDDSRIHKISTPCEPDPIGNESDYDMDFGDKTDPSESTLHHAIKDWGIT